MLKKRRWIALWIGLLLSYGYASELGKVTYQKVDERNYAAVLMDKQDNPILRLTVKYIGKEPIGTFQYDHDWKAIDTDFYDVTWENLTDSPIVLVSGKRVILGYRGQVQTQKMNEKGEWEKTNASSFIDIKKEYPYLALNGLKAKEKRTAKNLFIYYPSFTEAHHYLTCT